MICMFSHCEKGGVTLIKVYDIEKIRSNPPYLKETCTYDYNSECLKQPDKVAALMKNVFGIEKKAEEYAYVLSLDASCGLLGVFELSHGTASASMVSTRELFIRLLLCGAVGFILVHNHPSGNITPSNEDIRLTKNVQSASTLMNVKFLDHIIVGYDDYYSFANHAMI